MGELAEVSEEAIRAFSTRRRALLEHMEALGTEGFAAARVAALATREGKEQVDLPQLREQWRVRAAEHGLGQRQLERLVYERPLPSARVVPEELATGVFGLTATQTTFSMPELVRAVAGSLRDGAPIEHVLEAAEELSRFPGVELVEPGEVPGRPARFTTHELLELERGALDLAIAGQNAETPAADAQTLLRLLNGSELTREQHEFVRRAALSRNRVVCVVGAAGAGKTTALAVLHDAFGQTGVPMVGAAPSGRAADELQTATGIPSSTLHRLLLDTARDGGLPHRCVLVVDEAGMAGTRILAPLLELVQAADGKAILVGDPAQLPAVDAGGLYPALCDQLDAVELSQNRRQHEPSERQALARLRAGDPEPYLTHAAKNGRLHLDDDPLTAKQRLLEDWWQADDPVGAVMLAYRREDIQGLNDAAHGLMLRAGRLGHDAHLIREREFRVGDRVLCRHNNLELGVRNGTRATITALDPTSLTLQTDAGATRPIPLDYAFKHLDHGYALTGHAAQGATVERAFVLAGDQGALHEWGYVACSRARTETRLYLTSPTLEPDLRRPDPDLESAPARLAHALRTSAAEPLATEQLQSADLATARAYAARRGQLEQQRAKAQQRLAQAQEKLDGLGWRGRGKRGDELRNQIAWQHTAIRLADEKLRKPVPEQIARSRRDPAPMMPARERTLNHRLARGALEPARRLEHERGFGIEL